MPGSPSNVGRLGRLKPGKYSQSPDAVAHSQRTRLLDGFARTVAEVGYGRLTVVQVTDAAGVSKKTFYVYFSSLEECFLACYEYGTAILLARIARAREEVREQAGPGAWRERIRTTLTTLFKVLAEEPAFARMAVIEANAAGRRARRAKLAFQSTIRSYLEDVPGHTVPRPVVDAVVGGLFGTVHTYLEGGRGDELPGLAPELTYFVLLPYLDKAEAAAELGY